MKRLSQIEKLFIALVASMLWISVGLAQTAAELDALTADPAETNAAIPQETADEAPASNSESSDDLGGLADSAEGLGGLGGLAESPISEEPSGSSNRPEEPAVQTSSPAKAVQFGGYVKPLAYWQRVSYSDTAWQTMAAFRARGYAMPQKQISSGYTDLGIRYQFTMESFLSDSVRFYGAINMDFNEASNDTNAGSRANLVESYIEFFQSNRTLKVGSQLVTWGYMEGAEVPTDRINARDFSYTSTEFEDSKMASTGILLQQSLGDFSGIDVMLIPKAKGNVDPALLALFLPAETKRPDSPNDAGKMAFRYFSTFGDLDLAVSYVEGMDPAGDLYVTSQGAYGRSHHRERSPGIDLQYNLGSFLAKLAIAQHNTEDSAGDDPWIKNSWTHWAGGAEVMFGSNTINIYAGQKLVSNFKSDTTLQQTNNYLMGQAYQRTDFVSGHLSANFLPGDALSTTLIFANYWNDKGKVIQSFIKPTLSYKLAGGLVATVSPAYIEADGTTYETVQGEVKYTF